MTKKIRKNHTLSHLISSLLAMARFTAVYAAAVVVAAAFFLMPAAVSGARDLNKKSSFVVQGRVFCDTCRATFETPATTYIAGIILFRLAWIYAYWMWISNFCLLFWLFLQKVVGRSEGLDASPPISH